MNKYDALVLLLGLSANLYVLYLLIWAFRHKKPTRSRNGVEFFSTTRSRNGVEFFLPTCFAKNGNFATSQLLAERWFNPELCFGDNKQFLMTIEHNKVQAVFVATKYNSLSEALAELERQSKR